MTADYGHVSYEIKEKTPYFDVSIRTACTCNTLLWIIVPMQYYVFSFYDPINTFRQTHSFSIKPGWSIDCAASLILSNLMLTTSTFNHGVHFSENQNTSVKPWLLMPHGYPSSGSLTVHCSVFPDRIQLQFSSWANYQMPCRWVSLKGREIKRCIVMVLWE